jgi:SAM-dependent methyltransferase
VIESETVPCPLCGSEETRVIFAGEGFSMGRCVSCGLYRQNPRVTEAWIRRCDYDAAAGSAVTGERLAVKHGGLEFWETKPQEAFLESAVAVERVRASPSEGCLWIDVGCQTGGMLVAARSRGFAVAGADVDSSAAGFCREHHGVDARAGTLREAAFPSGSAGVVSYRQVLEHVYDLHGELAEARRLLQPGGILLVEVPHGGGFKLRLDRMRGALGLMPRSRIFHNVPQHLYYFGEAQLRGLLEKAGFTPVESRTFGRYRRRRSPLRRGYERLRDRLRVGNKLRVVARRSADSVRLEA